MSCSLGSVEAADLKSLTENGPLRDFGQSKQLVVNL